MAGVTFADVSKIYPDGTRAVNELNLGIEDGEFMVLVGPSGCGKTTALRMVAGLEEISEGQLKIGDRVVNHVPSRDRDIAMVFQSYALYPHLTVYDNIAFSLKLKKMDKKEIDRRVHEAAQLLGLEPYLDRKPRALSGGQRQRVAMGRAIVREPAAFLMDEPLSNLDAKLRVQTRAEIKKLQDDLGTTTIYVTHDQVEAMTMGDRVAVMRKGELQQVDAPQELYDRPVNLFVGGFIGSPAMNLVEAKLERAERRLAAVAGSQTDRARRGDALRAARPEDLRGTRRHPRHPPGGSRGRGARARGRGPAIEGEVELTEALGSEIMVHFSIDAPPAITDEVRELAGGRRHHRASARRPRRRAARTIMVGRFGAALARPPRASTIEVAVDTRALHFFDPETGLGIYDGTEREEHRNDEATLHSARAARRRARVLRRRLRRRRRRGRRDAAAAPPRKGAPGNVSGTISVLAVWTGAEGEAFQAVLDGFKEENPDVKVSYKSAAGAGDRALDRRSRAATRPTSPPCRSRAS